MGPVPGAAGPQLRQAALAGADDGGAQDRHVAVGRTTDVVDTERLQLLLQVARKQVPHPVVAQRLKDVRHGRARLPDRSLARDHTCDEVPPTRSLALMFVDLPGGRTALSRQAIAAQVVQIGHP